LALTVLAGCAATAKVENTCLGWRKITAEPGSFVVGTPEWIAATTDPATGQRLMIDPAVIEDAGISIVGDKLSRQIDGHDVYYDETCRAKLSSSMPPPEREPGSPAIVADLAFLPAAPG